MDYFSITFPNVIRSDIGLYFFTVDSWFRNGSPTPLKRMLLGLEARIISIEQDDRSVKCVCSFIVWCRSYCRQMLLILLEETILFISRLKSPKIITSGISV